MDDCRSGQCRADANVVARQAQGRMPSLENQQLETISPATELNDVISTALH
jgi:hypothetical protein